MHDDAEAVDGPLFGNAGWEAKVIVTYTVERAGHHNERRLDKIFLYKTAPRR